MDFDSAFIGFGHHRGEDISRPLIRKILNEIVTTPDEFVAALKD